MSPPPYASDVRARGWRFELDMERVVQSDTWDLAAEIPMAQHALLMMWVTAWQQVPCGSMPADPNLIRAKLKVPAALWEPMRDVVMRGWTLHDDGRLYHPTITERVLGMLDAKKGERERKAAWRARKEAERAAALAHQGGGDERPDPPDGPESPNLSHGTNTGQTCESHGKDDTGTGTGTGTIDIPTNHQHAHAHVEPVDGQFGMHIAWRPSVHFPTLAKMAGLPMKDLPELNKGIGEFVAYWLTRDDVQRTQHEWDHALIKSMKRDQMVPPEQPRRAPMPAPGQDRKSRQLQTAALMTGAVRPIKPVPMETVDVDARLITR